MCRTLGAEALAEDARYTTNAMRVENRHELSEILAILTKRFDMASLMAALEKSGVPHGPVNTLDQVFKHPQAIHRGLVVDQDREDLSAPVRSVASPLRLSLTPVAYVRAPPRLGEHTEEVLAALPDPPVASSIVHKPQSATSRRFVVCDGQGGVWIDGEEN